MSSSVTTSPRRELLLRGAALATLGWTLAGALTGCASGSGSARTAAAAPTSTTAGASVRVPVSASPTASVSLRGCVPECSEGLTRPGELPAGRYQTQFFFGGAMTLVLGPGWSSTEDSTGELSLSRSDRPDDGLFLWEDVYPVRGGNRRVSGVPTTAAGLLTWFKGNRELTTSHQAAARIGVLPAVSIDVGIAPGASNDDPGCPVRVCKGFLSFPQWTESWGIAGSQVQRFRLADVSYGGQQHLLVAVTYPGRAADMASYSALVDPVLATVRTPASAA